MTNSGGRVHWFWHLLSMDVKRNYSLSMDYSEHNYLICRKEKSKLLTVVIIVRSSRNCFRMMYHNLIIKRSMYRSFKSARLLTDWLNKFLIIELENEKEIIERERRESYFVHSLRWYMRKENITQSTLAFAVGISQQGISKMLNRKWYPPEEIIIRIANYFNTNVENFIRS